MKERYKLVIIFLLILVAGFIFSNNKKEVNIIHKDSNLQNNHNNLAIMLETKFGSGIYEGSNSNTWPTEGYVFNKNLSKCENGNTISYDEINKQIIVKGINADKCYVYFDKVLIFANIIKNQITGNETEVVSGEGKIYYHNADLAGGAKDESYRYAGNNPNNFVCFGTGAEEYYSGDSSVCPDTNLYRIIGAFNVDGSYQVKLIKSEYITEQELKGSTTPEKYGDRSSALTSTTSYTYQPRVKNTSEINGFYWNNAEYISWTKPSSNRYNLWEYEDQQATLNKALNDSEKGYLKTLGTVWANKIFDTTWHIAGGTNSEIVRTPPYNALQVEMKEPETGSYPAPQTTSKANKIGLMYASDYGYAAANVNNLWTKLLNTYNVDDNRQNNWMYNGVYEWTISRSSDNSSSVYYFYLSGFVGNGIVNESAYGIRPVFYLNSSVEYSSGDGSETNPYRIN